MLRLLSSVALFCALSTSLASDSPFCAEGKLPTSDDILEMSTFGFWMPDEYELSPEQKSLNLSVLTHNLRCIRSACESGLGQAGVDACMDNLRLQLQNVFMFHPNNLAQQGKKACKCNYDQVKNIKTPDGNMDVCSAQFIHNCDVTSGSECMNAAAFVFENEVCSDPDNEEHELATEEIVEYFRVKKYCEAGVKTMLLDEYISSPRCKENEDRQDSLIAACGVDCYYNLKYVDMASENKFQQVVQYDWDWDCGLMEDPETSQEEYTKTVLFQGNKNQWHQVLDVCREFKQDGVVPEQVRNKSPVPSPFVSEESWTTVLDKCCTRDLEYYAGYKSDFSTAGKKEMDCFAAEDNLYDFGFIPSLVRGTMSRYSGQCFELYSKYETCTPTVSGMPEEYKCDDSMGVYKMNFDENNQSPDQIFWFLQYVTNDQTARANALEACAAGANFGRTVTVMPGVSLGLESQQYAVDNVPLGTQTVSMLAFHTCGVFASLHANNYFDLDKPCNFNALDMNVFGLSYC